ncbi:uncharacterized protein LOC105694435, partial [Orussus abietinus]|uniref:uncharacterized protein LOC105694435 n=1 Tax=Orussus abietinus TaxID=222816 RepID=UPI000C715E46
FLRGVNKIINNFPGVVWPNSGVSAPCYCPAGTSGAVNFLEDCTAEKIFSFGPPYHCSLLWYRNFQSNFFLNNYNLQGQGNDANRDKRGSGICKPESHFKIDNCNVCLCSSDGSHMACTSMQCILGEEYAEESFEILHRFVNAKTRAAETCEPGRAFNKDCNACRCSSDGQYAVCTKMSCPEEKAREASVQCEPGTSFKEDCNVCICNSDGTKAFCTKMWCTEKEDESQDSSSGSQTDAEEAVATTRSEETCEPNSSFKKDCNVCICSADGKHAACTKRFCSKEKSGLLHRFFKDGSHPEGSEDGPVATQRADVYCQPKSTFKNDCNICICNDRGTNAACTGMACLRQEDSGNLEENQSLGRTEKITCEPNSTFNVKCNVCICSSDGKSAACTKKWCFNPKRSGVTSFLAVKGYLYDEDKILSDPDYSPQKGGYSKNKGHHDGDHDGHGEHGGHPDDAPARYRRDVEESLRDEINSKNVTCEPNSSFNTECNACICSSDGKSAVCTRMWCSGNEVPGVSNFLAASEYFYNEDKILNDPNYRPQKGGYSKNKGHHYGDHDQHQGHGGYNGHQEQGGYNGHHEHGGTWGYNGHHEHGGYNGHHEHGGYNGHHGEHFDDSPARYRRDVQKCVPNSRFKDKCNSCICSAEGTYAYCTLKHCLPILEEKEKSPQRTKRDVQQRICNPLAVLEDGCVTCTCLGDGTSFFCTEIVCLAKS